MADFLDNLLVQKREEVEKRRKEVPFSALYQSVKGLPPSSLFSRSLSLRKAVIAEIKRASPSRGSLFSGDRVEELGRIYEAGGASAVSLVTERKYFHGNVNDLPRLKARVHIPVLQKDFMIEEYQILESKKWRADAVLFIVSLLPVKRLAKFLSLVEELGMDAVVEVHSQVDLKKALDVDAPVIGINNRDLKTLKVDLETSRNLLPLIPDSKIKIVESGIREEKDLLFYQGFKINAFLIGEALVTASRPEEKLRRFCSVLKES